MKKLLSFILTAVMAMSVFSVITFAEAVQRPGMIVTPEDLMAVEETGNYCLVNSIDMSGYELKGIEEFAGSFNGDGYTISNLSSDTCGLFGTLVSGAVVKNVHLENAAIVTNEKYAGRIAAYIPSNAKNITITNCSVNGKIASHYNNYKTKSKLNYCGGIVGVNLSKSSVITDCRSSAIVEANFGVGGVVGLNYGSVDTCSFSGTACCVRNDHEICSCGEEGHNDIIYNSTVSGGICAVNYGSVKNCVSHVDLNYDSRYMGSVCGIIIKNKGKCTDYFTINAYIKDEADEDYFYEDIGNVVTSKKFSAFFK